MNKSIKIIFLFILILFLSGCSTGKSIQKSNKRKRGCDCPRFSYNYYHDNETILITNS